MDAVCFDDWEVLPDQASSFSMKNECGNDHDGKDQLLLGAELVMVDMDHFAAAASHRGPYGCVLGEDAKKPLLPSPDVRDRESVPVTEFKDIGVVHTELKRVASMSKVTEILISDDAEGEEEVFEFPDGVKEVVQDEVRAEAAAAPGHHHQFAGEDDEGGAKKTGFSVGNLRVHGAGALCSFGVAAATFCIFLLGGKQPQQHRSQNHKIQLQMYADEYDQRIQRAMQQASRLNQTMSSVMGGATSSPRASISFGGHYRGF